MVSPRHLFTVPIAFAAFAATFIAVAKLLAFLSTPIAISGGHTWLYDLLDGPSLLELLLPPLSVDLILALVFVLQHSLMRTAAVSALWRRFGLETVERSLYNSATALTLNFVLSNWRPIASLYLWKLDVHSSDVLWWSFVALHALAWSIVLGGTILMDLPELLGVKQVFYDTQRLPSPMMYKSDELKRLYGHVRHPSFVGLVVVLWTTNYMCVDRLVLAVVWTLYMYVAWNTDDDDVMYHRCQLARKRSELASEANGGGDVVDGRRRLS